MWRTILTRNANLGAGVGVQARFSAQRLVNRNYSLKSDKIQALVRGHQRALEEDRDLILKVMGTLPSPREARQFLSRFSPPTSSALSSGSPGTTPETKNGSNFLDSIQWSTDHLALIKLEGSFDKESLATIAKTLVQLQRLGLMSLVMMDNPEWWQSQDIAQDDSSDVKASHSVEIRKRMTKDMMEIIDEIEKFGGSARPIYDSVIESPEFYESSTRTPPSADQLSIQPGLLPIRSCLRLRQIPIMIPLATTLNSHRVPVHSNDALVALAKYMGDSAKRTEPGSTPSQSPLIPLRLIVINTCGGIPLTRSGGINGPTHCFVNLKDEYDTIVDDLNNMNHIPEPLAKRYRSDLDMIRDSLEYLPPTCSALITSSPSLTLITNLITDKPLFSSTTRGQDPKVMLATTVLRNGLDIFTFHKSLHGLDLKRLQGLLESSFGKPLDAEGFYSRIENRVATVTLAGGDYMGAAIVTQEGGTLCGEGEERRTLAKVAYLDKFSIAPKSQGIGVADILWKKLTDEFPDLVWRSRSDNPVNKW
ncbi:Amino-acid acetyltransferase, mitochondrial [Entomortierella beljakovae]|nr:Amino-acid acetyltransferase, mitochondrial [Entomortierella beljakovae]